MQYFGLPYRPAAALGCARRRVSFPAPGAAAITFAESEKVIAAFPSDRAQPFEACVALFEREIHPSPPLEPGVFGALVDERLIRAVGVFFRFDQKVEPSLCGLKAMSS